MPQVDKIKIGPTTYNIAAAPDAETTFISEDTAQNSATSWSDVTPLAAGETNRNIFNKISAMFKNIRYLKNIIGAGFTTESNIATQLNGKAPLSHKHTVADLPVSHIQINSEDYIPDAKILFDMNERVDALYDATAVVDPVSGLEITEGDGYAILKWVNPTGPNYKLTKVIQKTGSAPTSLTDGKEIYSGKGTTVQANGLEVGSKYFWSVFTTNNLGKVSDPVSISYTPRTDPNSRPYNALNVSTWNNTADVNNFFTKYTHATGYADGDTELAIGNRITIRDGEYNKTWIIAGFDLEHNKQASDGTTYDNGYGIFLVPETSLKTMAWNSNGSTNGGYMNSEIHKNINGAGCNSMRRLLNNHLVQRNVLLSNAISGNNANNYVWSKAYMTLMSIGQMTGTFAQNNNRYDDGEANYKLPLFNFIGIGVPNEWFWSRGIISSSNAWSVDNDGSVNHGNVGSTGSVRPLICVR